MVVHERKPASYRRRQSGGEEVDIIQVESSEDKIRDRKKIPLKIDMYPTYIGIFFSLVPKFFP